MMLYIILRLQELARQLYQQELDRSKKKPTKSTLNRQESDAVGLKCTD